jgi:hypothetical protein
MIIVRQKLTLRHPIVIALIILSASYAAISGSTVGLTTVQWDEFVDLQIAESLSSHPLSGGSHDGSQARLPMYVTALAYRFMQIFKPEFELLDLLPVTRWISISMTVLAIWGTFSLGSRLFDRLTGVLAASLFTFSPYVLHFGRDALTQGDAFTSATVVLALIAFDRFDVQRTTVWLAVFAFFLSLAIASKFFLVILIPALFTYQVIRDIKNISTGPVLTRMPTRIDQRATIPSSYVFLSMATGVLALLALIISLLRFRQPAATGQIMYQTSLALWLVTLLGIVCSLVVPLKDIKSRATSIMNSYAPWALIWPWLAILPLTFAMVLALFPDHIFNGRVVPTLLKRSIPMDGNSDLFTTPIVSAKLYLGLVLFKIGLPFGIATCIALIWGAARSAENKSCLLITLILVHYGVLLAILPLQQPFWLMSVYPLILLLLAAFIVHNLKGPRNIRHRLGWAGYVVFCFAWLAVGLFNVYPTFGYYGYEVVGKRWLGSESRGYRALVVVTNDGSKEAMDWLRKNVPEHSLVLSYLDDLHLINYLANKNGLAFKLQHALDYMTDAEIERDLAKADFVIVRVVNDFGKPTPVSNRTFIQRFGSAPAYQIVRGRGIYRFPVIQIYERIRPDLRAGISQPLTTGSEE